MYYPQQSVCTYSGEQHSCLFGNFFALRHCSRRCGPIKSKHMYKTKADEAKCDGSFKKNVQFLYVNFVLHMMYSSRFYILIFITTCYFVTGAFRKEKEYTSHERIIHKKPCRLDSGTNCSVSDFEKHAPGLQNDHNRVDADVCGLPVRFCGAFHRKHER